VHTKISNGAERLRLGVDYTFTSEMFNDVQNTALLARPSCETWWTRPRAMCRPSGKATFTIGGHEYQRQALTITTGQPQFCRWSGLRDLQRATRVVMPPFGVKL